MSDIDADYIIVGAGIAGAATAYWLSRHARVLVLERESQAGYHSTGRSAAVFIASYGPAQVRALSAASRAFFDSPPAGFCQHPLLTRREGLVFAQAGQEAELAAYERMALAASPRVHHLDAAQALARVPVLRPGNLAGAVVDDDISDIDVDGLLQGFLRGVRAQGGKVVFDADVQRLDRVGGAWRVGTTRGACAAPVLVNAAGAWADRIGALAGAAPLGLVPRRRSALLFEPPPDLRTERWPMFADVGQSFYVKPDAGLLLGSGLNADPVGPHDVQAEELDIAIAIDAIQTMTTLTVRRPRHVWAGLRSFVEDGEFAAGFDRGVPGLFWAAAQGGYGIQTAPAAGMLFDAMLRGAAVPEPLVRAGVDPALLDPARLR
jgi:D-arginine dehydrogenase